MFDFSYAKTYQAVQDTLKRLQLDYVDSMQAAYPLPQHHLSLSSVPTSHIPHTSLLNPLTSSSSSPSPPMPCPTRRCSPL